MKKTRLLASLLVMCIFLAGCGVEYINPYVSIPKPVATMALEMDSVMYVMRFTLDPAAAPNTVSNFINLANSGFYDGLKIDYVYPTYFLRGGDPDGDGTGGPDYTIDGEFSANDFKLPGLRHTRGVISMCRLLDDYNSAGSQFFIMLSPHSEFNGEYAAFGCIESSDSESLATLEALESALVDRSYRPVLRQTITSIRVDTKGYIYEVIKHGEQEEAQPAGSPNV
ncbi:MAG: peptidylprolyl isomerase [Clostridia bacterium]|nr:peptidylprolyl isomerase [Clostridia bacterium]